MRESKLFFKNVLFQAFYFMGFSTVMIYLVLYMQSLGFSTLAVGTLMALANLIGALSQAKASAIADSGRFGGLKNILFLHLIVLFLALLPLLLGKPGKALSALLLFLHVSLLIALQGSSNSVPMAFEKAGHQLHFSVLRASGSLSFGLSSLIMGRIFEQLGIQLFPWVLAVANLAFALAIALLPTIPQAYTKEKAGQKAQVQAGLRAKKSGKDASLSSKAGDASEQASQSFFRKYPIFLPLLIGFTLLFTTHQIINNYLALILENVGAGPSMTGLASLIATLAEAAMLFSYPLLRKKFSDLKLLLLSAILFTVKAGILTLAKEPGMVFFSQAFQMFGFGLYVAGISYLAADLVEEKDLVQGQSIATIVMSLGGCIGALLGGGLLQVLSMHHTLLVSLAVSFLGSLVILGTLGRAKLD